jgi:hypothetical protein
MQLEVAAFLRLRRLAPVLDDLLNAGEIEHAGQAVSLVSLAQLCMQLFDAYHGQHPGETERARSAFCEPQSCVAQVSNSIHF